MNLKIMNRFYKTILLLFPAIAGGWISMQAQDRLLVYTIGESAAKTISLENIRKITFSDDGFTIDGTGGDAAGTYTFTDVQSLKFDALTTGICHPQATAGSDLRLYSRDGSLCADGLADDRTVQATLYTVSGRHVLSYSNWDGSPIQTATLPHGVYIFKVNNKTYKFTK